MGFFARFRADGKRATERHVGPAILNTIVMSVHLPLGRWNVCYIGDGTNDHPIHPPRGGWVDSPSERLDPDQYQDHATVALMGLSEHLTDVNGYKHRLQWAPGSTWVPYGDSGKWLRAVVME